MEWLFKAAQMDRWHIHEHAPSCAITQIPFVRPSLLGWRPFLLGWRVWRCSLFINCVLYHGATQRATRQPSILQTPRPFSLPGQEGRKVKLSSMNCARTKCIQLQKNRVNLLSHSLCFKAARTLCTAVHSGPWKPNRSMLGLQGLIGSESI